VKKGELKVRPATSDDYPAIASLLDRTFGKIPFEKRIKLWQWRHDNNPAQIPEIPGFLLAEKSGQIVGVHGLTPMRVKVGDRQYHAACSCDFAIDQTARSVGMKIKLKTLSKEISSLPISTSANKPANKITLALGGKEFIASRRKLLKPLKASGFIQKIVARKVGAVGEALATIISILIGKPLDWILVITRYFRSFSKVANAKIQNINQFDQRFDKLWEQVSQSYPILIVRDSLYLNWRYANYPFSGVQQFGLFCDNELLGFAVIHNTIDEDGLSLVAILELFVPPSEKAAFEHLLKEIIKRATQVKAHYIKAWTLVPEWEELFTHYGFKVRDSSFSPTTYKNNTDLPNELFTEDGNWYMSLGDGDICYYF